MGYVSRQKYFEKCYVPSDDIITIDTSEDFIDSTSYNLVKTIMLVAPIISQSLFRFKFDIHCSGGATAKGQIYRNGSIVGTEQSTVSVIYVTKTEDILTTSWAVGDTIQIYGKTSDPAHPAYFKNFTLCGVGSEFLNA